MRHSLIPKEHDTDACHLASEVVINIEIHYNYIDGGIPQKLVSQNVCL